jgi:hypothetical protein
VEVGGERGVEEDFAAARRERRFWGCWSCGSDIFFSFVVLDDEYASL